MYDQRGIDTLEKLKADCDRASGPELTGSGPDPAKTFEGLAFLDRMGTRPLDQALALARSLLERFGSCPGAPMRIELAEACAPARDDQRK